MQIKHISDAVTSAFFVIKVSFYRDGGIRMSDFVAWYFCVTLIMPVKV